VSSLRTELKDDVLVVYITASKILDNATIQKIGQELTELAEQNPGGKIVLNFQEVKFMSSAMINNIVNFHRKCQKADVKLKLCDISKDVMEVFNLMKLQKFLDIQKTEEKAIASFDKKGWFG
jgi:anti-sigma B factor antagonist